MGNNHSEQYQQSKGNPENKQESLSKQKKDTDIWSSFRNKTKSFPVAQPSPFKPMSPNIFKGIPDFTSAGATSTFYRKQLLKEPTCEEEKKLNSSSSILLLPQTTVTPNQVWVAKEPSAYNISWERPQLNSLGPPPISSFIFPSVVDDNPPKDPLKPAPRTDAPPGTNSCQKNSPRIHKEVFAQEQAKVSGIKEAPASTSCDAPVPFFFTGTTPETTEGPSTSEVTAVDFSLGEKSEKLCSDNAVVNHTVSKNSKANRQTPVVISEQTHAEIMSRLYYVEKKNSLLEPPANQNQAVVRRALNGGSYAEAVRKSQPKINPARRGAKAKLFKKLSKDAKITETMKDVNSEQGGIVSQQLPFSNQAPPIGSPDQGITPKKNTTAATEKTTNFNQSEKSAIPPKSIEQEKEVLLESATKKTVQTTTNTPSKNTKPENKNLTPNPSMLLQQNFSAKGSNPYQKASTSKTVIYQAHSAPTVDLNDKSQLEEILKSVRSTLPVDFHYKLSDFQSQLKAALQATDVSDLFLETPKQTKQSSEKTAKTERRKVRESVKHMEVSSKVGVKQPAADILQDCSDNSATDAIQKELLNPKEPLKESLKPPKTPHKPAISSVSIDASVKSSSFPYCSLPTNEQGITSKGTRTSSPKFRDHQTQKKTPVQAIQVQTKMKEVKDLPPKSKVTENENTNTKNKETLEEAKPSPPSPQPHRHPEGRWHPFTTDWSCVQKVRCRHRENGTLPKNIMQWMSVSRNYLCEPPWVTTASLAASIALSVRLDREDSRQ